ncbi:MAG: GAF domain-containing protein [Acidobacteriota bacterium]
MARAIAFLLCLLTLAAQENYRMVTLDEAGARTGPDFKPALLGETVRVRGIVQADPIEAPDATDLALLDAERRAKGLMLVYSGDNRERAAQGLEAKPGTVVQAVGLVSLHAGQAVIKPTELTVLGQSDLPAAPILDPLTAASFRYLGREITVEGEIENYQEGSWGDLLDFRGEGSRIRVFLPLLSRGNDRPLKRYLKGDRVRVRGLVSQFCLRPPYNKFFQLLISDASKVTLLEQGQEIQPQMILEAVVMTLLGILGFWYQQQRVKNVNRQAQRLLDAGEEIYGLNTAREVADLLRARLLEVIPASTASVYHYNSHRKVLERIPDQSRSTPHSFHIEECGTTLEKAIGFAVRTKTLQQFRNTSAVEKLETDKEGGQSVLVIPMKNRNEVWGALVVVGPAGKTLLGEALLTAAQHLANDAGQYFDGIEQAALREQNHRSEKLAVAGQLIHGVVTELNAPLERIRDLTAALPESEATAIHVQVRKASETVKRIVSVAQSEQMDARPIDLRYLFQRLVESMQEEVRQGQIEMEMNLGPESVHVLGSQEQLLRVFDNLFLHARAASEHSLERRLIINLSHIGRNAMIEIEFSGPFGEGEGPDFSGSALGMAITRGLLQSYGGELRFKILRAGRNRYDVELPSLSASPAEEFAGSLPFGAQRGILTALLVEPEITTQRRMLAIFGDLNHRLVPVANVGEAADIAEKIQFDVVFARARPEGGTWVELFHRLHHRVPHFVLLSESASEADSDLLTGKSSSMLRKPLKEEAIWALLEQLQLGSGPAAG